VQVASAVVLGEVAINEFMASNDFAVADEADEFDDWVELRNNSLTEWASLKDWHLTDTLGIPDKWKFPDDASMAPESYMTIWLDENGDQGDFHANFKLDADGEEIYLIDAGGNIVDQVIFGQQTTDLSFSRIPNGTGDFVIKDFTFGCSNEVTSSTEESIENSLHIFPNPVLDILNIVPTETNPLIEYHLLDFMGRDLLSIPADSQNIEVDLSGYEPGIYIITKENKVIGRFVKI